MGPKWRRRLSGAATVAMLPLWVASHLWFARDEPQVVLALSWLALIMSTATLWATTDVRVEEEKRK